ncbi:MAG TPA: asparagine synthase-related protein, partial [Longimicrobiales bacterium]|nr:asparagine synthase-related protein [Longimicrobiales bacterium]
MALFAGIWHRGGGRLRAGAETDLLAALHAPFHSVLSAYDDDAFAVVARSVTEPTIVSRGGIVAAFGGRLDGHLTAADVLDAYLDPAGRFRSISGDYAIAVFDPMRHTLLLMRDAVGTQPMYYCASDDGSFVFGSQAKAVMAGAAMRPEINRGALAQLLVGNDGLPRGQTCFSGVYSLPPGQVLFVTPDTISSTTHVDLRPIVPTPLKTFEQSCAAFKRALCTSVDRRISPEKPTAILVSGGLDSAAILAAARNATNADRLVAISYGLQDGSGADESRYVDVVTQATGVRSVRVDFEPLGFLEHVQRDAWATETPSVDDVPATLSRAAT